MILLNWEHSIYTGEKENIYSNLTTAPGNFFFYLINATIEKQIMP